MYCKYCGKEIENEVKHCPHCGGIQNNPVMVGSPQLDKFFNSKAGQTFKLVSIPIIGFIMLITAIVGLVIAPKSTWLIIACVMFICLGVGCLIQFAFEIVKRNNNKNTKE